MNTIGLHNSKNTAGTRKRRRGQGLFGLVCVSLCAGSATGFVNFMHPSRQQHPLQPPSFQNTQEPSSMLSVVSSSSTESDNTYNSGKQTKRRMNFPRLTVEEEQELLGRAVEYRRLNELEKELALTHHNSLPLLSIRAKHAGYGEDLDGYEDAKFEGQLARETLVTHNMGLVHHCVNQIIGKESFKIKNNNKNPQFHNKNKGLPLNSLSREDLIQEGAIGLARAVDKWNPEIGGKFSTYAVYWVRAAVLRCIAERDDVVRVPNHVSQAVLQINKAAKRLGWVLQESGGILVTEHAQGGGSESSIAKSPNSPRWKAANAAKRLAEEAGLSERRFEEAMKARRRRYSGGYVPFESWMQTTSRMAKQQHASDENADHDRQTMDTTDANEEIRSVLSKHLRPKEMEALSWRYGLLREEDQQTQHPNESIQDRAKRQFLEMEDQLFGSSATTVAAASAAATTKQVSSLAKPTARAVQPTKASAAAPVAKGRFGEAMTFTEVGKKMQVSAEYTRRLCHKALNKLQQAAEDGTLEPACLI